MSHLKPLKEVIPNTQVLSPAILNFLKQTSLKKTKKPPSPWMIIQEKVHQVLKFLLSLQAVNV